MQMKIIVGEGDEAIIRFVEEKHDPEKWPVFVRARRLLAEEPLEVEIESARYYIRTYARLGLLARALSEIELSGELVYEAGQEESKMDSPAQWMKVLGVDVRPAPYGKDADLGPEWNSLDVTDDMIRVTLEEAHAAANLAAGLESETVAS